MMSVRETRPGKGFLASRWSLIIGVVVLLTLTVAFARAYYQNYRTQEEIRRLRAEASYLEAKKLETLEALKYVQSPAYVEEKARTELNLVKPGERVAVIPGTVVAGAAGIGQSTEKVVESASVSNSRRWWDYFFGD
ncbi:MAG: septum formation initiator family protein [Candidatus Magasanikbacteria bacterium]|nr:septum formation initiator family protein [Candidatus Magasanikbacteria bacterium]